MIKLAAMATLSCFITYLIVLILNEKNEVALQSFRADCPSVIHKKRSRNKLRKKLPLSKKVPTFCGLPSPPEFVMKALVEDKVEKLSEKEVQKELILNEKMVLDREKYRYRLTEEEKEQVNKIKKIDYLPRFKVGQANPKDRAYYGIHLGEYKDVKTFLGVREYLSPSLYRLNNQHRDSLLFLNVNINRLFKGRAHIINEKYVTPIEGIFGFENFPPTNEVRYFRHEYVEFWLRNNSGNGYFSYGGTHIYEKYQSPWFYNRSTKGMSLAINECWLDQSYDMGLIDFFYLTQYDLLLGNFYCKKSSKSSWKRIAYLEFLRIR